MNRESSSSGGGGGEEALRFFALPFNDLAGEDMLYSILRRERKEGKMRESSPRLGSNYSLDLGSSTLVTVKSTSQ